MAEWSIAQAGNKKLKKTPFMRRFDTMDSLITNH